MLYSEILLLITGKHCDVDDLPWRFQLKLEEVFSSVATLEQVQQTMDEVMPNLNSQSHSYGVRARQVC